MLDADMEISVPKTEALQCGHIMEADREDICRFLANWNAKNLARITGRTIPEEHRRRVTW